MRGKSKNHNSQDDCNDADVEKLGGGAELGWNAEMLMCGPSVYSWKKTSIECTYRFDVRYKRK